MRRSCDPAHLTRSGIQAVVRMLVALALTAGITQMAVQAIAQTTNPGSGEQHGSNVDVQATGVFLNAAGDVLTARHAVAGCGTVYVIKDGRLVAASARIVSDELDLAVLRTSLRPYLTVTLPASTNNTFSSIAVFAEAYSVLQRLPDRGILLSNAMATSGEGSLQLMSGAKPGASGSAVLGSAGLLLGLVVERVGAGAAAGSDSTVRTLSRAAAAGAPTSATLVRAIGAAPIKNFLHKQGIVFHESDVAQLGPGQSPASRAATLSVGVICG